MWDDNLLEVWVEKWKWYLLGNVKNMWKCNIKIFCECIGLKLLFCSEVFKIKGGKLSGFGLRFDYFNWWNFGGCSGLCKDNYWKRSIRFLSSVYSGNVGMLERFLWKKFLYNKNYRLK